eukprot:gene15423-21505_t
MHVVHTIVDIAKKDTFFAFAEGNTIHIDGQHLMWDFGETWDEIAYLMLLIEDVHLHIYPNYENRYQAGGHYNFYPATVPGYVLDEICWGFRDDQITIEYLP